ncbi:FtsX-like permease family protein [Pseudopedobacter beijingensis]|uniref:FtsX-like permease family protein n=1 Tax=Pseudopedobacter beijingensis TaxID=1207056 RepID=A0ABW4IDN7_9SPHI
MNLPLYIAKRYLFSKKSTNAINIISGISTLGVFVGSAALIIILSVYNGFESLVLSMYDQYSPDLKIEASQGKSFDPTSQQFKEVQKIPGLISYTEVLQEKALIRYDKYQFIGKVKGVSDQYLKNSFLDSALVQGEFILKDEHNNYAVIGSTVQYILGVNINDQIRKLEIYSPIKGKKAGFSAADEFLSEQMQPVGVFQAQQEDNDMVIVPLELARTLIGEEKNVSAVEIFLKDREQTDKIKRKIEKSLGDEFLVKDRMQQNAQLYKILNSEKWAIYLILSFVLIIAIFNIIGSLTMLVIDKRKDIAILNSLGASKRLINSIILSEGLMISLIGCFFGLIIGTLFCLLQLYFGVVPMGEGNMLINYYPVEIRPLDYLLVFFTVFTISFIASFISSRLSTQRFEQLRTDL